MSNEISWYTLDDDNNIDHLTNIRQIKANKALQYCRTRGFPFYEYSKDEKIVELNKIKKSKFKSAIQDGEILQLMHGMGLAWSYFPHHWEVPIGKQKTPFDVFYNDDLLTKSLVSRLRRGGDNNITEIGYITDSQIRKAIRTASGTQSVSNFRPVAAASLYYTYANNGVVWDMSCGFGGRLIGAMASGSVKKYIGTDPSTKTFDGLLKIKEEFSYVPIEIELHKCGSETFIPNCIVDLCFTSPPYFNTEQYSIEETQSYVKFTTPEEWNEGFLRKSIQNCKACLSESGYMILNVANVKSHKTLEPDTIRIAQEEGFYLKETLKLRLSSVTKGGYKFEPVFVFCLESGYSTS